MKNKMITFILSLIIIYTAVGINANADISSPEDVKDWEVIFGVTEPIAIVKNYLGNETDISVPDTILGYTVTEVDFSAFPVILAMDDLDGVHPTTSIYIPETVKQVTISPPLKFETNLRSLSINGNEVMIQLEIDNDHIEELTIPHFKHKSQKSYDRSYIRIKNAPLLKKLSIAGTYDLLEIDQNNFKDCSSLKEIVFPKQCSYIRFGSFSFENCGFEILDIPYDAEIGQGAFESNDLLTNVLFSGKTDLKGYVFYNCPKLENVKFANGGSAEKNAFLNCSSLKNIDITDDVTFDSKAFDECTSLMTINSEPAFDSETGDFSSKYRDFILANFNGAQDVGFINQYVEANVKRIVNEVISDNMSDIQKAKALHDWLCDNTGYDHDSVDADRNHHDASVLMNDKTVCEGYASFYDLLLREAGVESYYVHSSDHAWNIINIDGHFFHSDTTWDDLTSSYKYFLKSDSEMKSEGGSHGSWNLLKPSSLHDYTRTSAPECKYSMGDVNTDGELNSADLVCISQYLHGRSGITKANRALADVCCDGETDVFDVVALRRKVINEVMSR